MSRLLDWLLGRGRNPLERARDRPAVPVDDHARALAVDAVDAPAPPLPEESDLVLEQWARELGVSVGTMRVLVEQRRALVYDVAAAPRDWGFDLSPTRAPRRDVAAEFRRRTRLTGALGDSFLSGHAPLLGLVPDPPTMPDGTPLDDHLAAHAGLSPDAARDVAQHVRTSIQATLGAPLDRDAFEHAAREAAWDHDLDAAHACAGVLGAIDALL